MLGVKILGTEKRAINKGEFKGAQRQCKENENVEMGE